MLKTFLFAAFFFCAASAAFAAQGDDGFYTRADAGYVYSTLDGVKETYAAQTGFGQKYGDFLRAEFDLSFTRVRLRGAEAFDGRAENGTRAHTRSFAAMGTLFADLFSVGGTTPYVGVGGGIARNALQDFTLNGRRMAGDIRYHAAWQAVGGVGIDLPANFTLDVSYSYMDAGNVKTKKNGGERLRQDVKMRKVLLGLRYNF